MEAVTYTANTPATKQVNPFQAPSNYAFGYSVKDDYSGDDFSHNEVRDGYKTEGEYRVALPDGRVQIVSYIADENGYHADVRKSVTIRAINCNSNFYNLTTNKDIFCGSR